MTARARRRRETLRHWCNFVAGLLIGVAIWTPVLAATEYTPASLDAHLAHGDWSTLVMVASIVLLGIGVLLRIRAREQAPQTHDPEDSIGRYRPQIYRP